MKTHEKIHLSVLTLLIFTIGAATGYPLGYFRAQRHHFPDLKWTKDLNEGISVVKLMEVKNGRLRGEISGEKTRVAYSAENILTVEPGEAFEIPLHEINLNTYYQARHLPKGTLFIASKNGKYYYSVFDKQAFSIAEKNRLYFSDAEKAEAAGYLKKE